MGKFKKNTAMITNQGIDMVVNKTEEPLLKLKKRAKPLKVSNHKEDSVSRLGEWHRQCGVEHAKRQEISH